MSKHLTRLYNRAKINYNPLNYTLMSRCIDVDTKDMYNIVNDTFSQYIDIIVHLTQSINVLISYSMMKIPYDYFHYNLHHTSKDYDINNTNVGYIATLFKKDNLYLHNTMFSAILEEDYYGKVSEEKFVQHPKTRIAKLSEKDELTNAILQATCAITRKDSLFGTLLYLFGINTRHLTFDELYTLSNVEKTLEKIRNTEILSPTDTFLIANNEFTLSFIPKNWLGKNISNAEIAYTDTVDTDCKRITHLNIFVYGLEVITAIETLSDDLKNLIYANIVKYSSNDISKMFFEATTEGVLLKPEVKKITILKPELRFNAIKDLLEQNVAIGYFTDLINNSASNPLRCSHLFATLLEFAKLYDLSTMYTKTIVLLLEFCKKYKINVIREIPNEDLLDALDEITTSTAKESLSGLERFLHFDDKYDKMNTSKDTKTVDSKIKTSDEFLDLATASFKEAGYSFDTKDVVDTSDVLKASYEDIVADMSLLNNSLIKSLKDIKTYNEGGKLPGLKAGKLDSKNLYKYKTNVNIFCQNKYKIKESDLAICCVLDVSGSMCGNGIKNGKLVMILLHETLKALGINHCILTHTSDGYHHCDIKRYQAFKEDKTYKVCKNYALLNIKAQNGNCDSGALYYAEKELLKARNKDKICLIFSDGQPTECTDYELKQQIRRMNSNGIKTIGIGINFESIKEYYPDNANGRNLKEMFDIVANILKEYVLTKKD